MIEFVLYVVLSSTVRLCPKTKLPMSPPIRAQIGSSPAPCACGCGVGTTCHCRYSQPFVETRLVEELALLNFFHLSI
jgi:hypothetical protein